MAKRTQQMPVLRAHARFSWAQAPLETTGAASAAPSSAPVEFIVGLYSNGAVDLDAPPPYAGLVTGLEWVDTHDVIRNDGGHWSPANDWDDSTKQRLLLNATNALRRQMGLPPHGLTSERAGSE